MFYAIDIVAAPIRVIRYGVVVQVPIDPGPSLPYHLTFSQYITCGPCPLGKFTQTLPELLTAGATLDLEVTLLGLAAIMREAQECEFLGFLAPFTGILACETAKLDTASLIFRQFQGKLLDPFTKLLTKVCCIAFILKAGHKVIGKAEVIALAATLFTYTTAKPKIRHVM